MYKYIGKPYHFLELIDKSEFFRIINDFLNNLYTIKSIDEEILETTNRALLFNDFLNLYSLITIEPQDIDAINSIIDEFISNYNHDSFIILLLPAMPCGIFPIKDDYIQTKISRICDINQNNIETFFTKYYDEGLLKNLNSFIETQKKSINENLNICSYLLNYFETFLETFRKNSFQPFTRYLSFQNNHNPFGFSFTVNSDNSQPTRYDSMERYLILEKLLSISSLQDLNEISIRKRASLYSILLNDNEETLRKYINNYNKSLSKQSKKVTEKIEKIENLFKIMKIKE